MSSAFNRSRSNPLIQRVRRHAAIATLFRAPLAPGDALTQPPTPAQVPLDSAGLPRTRAYALPLQPPLETPEFSAGAALPPADLGPTQTSSAPTSGPRSTTPPPTAIQRSTEPTATSPSTAPPTPGDELSAAAPVAGLTSPSTTQPVQPMPVMRAVTPASTSSSTARPVQRMPIVGAAAPASASASTAQPVQPPTVVRAAAPANPSSAAPTAPGAPASSAGSVQPPPAPAVPLATAAPQTTSPQPAGSPDEESKLSERDWNRLSTIMRRHQDAAAPQDQPSQPASSPAASQPAEPGTPADPAPQIVQRAPSSGSSPAVPNQPAIQPPAPAPSAGSLQAAPNLPASQSPNPAPGAGSSPALPHADQPAAAQPAPASPAVLSAGALSQPPAGLVNQTVPTAETSAQTSTGTSQPSPAGSTPSTSPPLPSAADYVPPESPHTAARPSSAAQEDTRPLGLEAAWPVQRRVADTPRPVQPAVPNLPPVPVPLDEQTRHVEHIQRALAGVSSGQPTGSKIEVIPPRQPRPAPASAARPASDYAPEGPPPASFPALPIDPEAASQLTGSIQRAAARQSSSTEAAPQAGQPRTVRPGAPPLPAHPSEQMPLAGQPPQGDTTLPAAQAALPHLVDTDIGPLPADLWGLLGQTAPGSELPAQRRPLSDSAAQASQPGETIQPSQSAAGTPVAPIQRAVSFNDFETQASPSRPAVADGQAAADAPQASQSARGAEGEAFSSAQQRAANSSTPSEQQPAAPDLDEIARQVYAEVKHRLQVEWERLRRKI